MRLYISAICVGFAAMTAQLLLVRELMVVSLGDELTVGLVFFAWMLWVGIGSAIGGLKSVRRNLPEAAAGLLMILLGILIPMSLLWARMQGPMFGFQHGEAIPVDKILLMSITSLAPVCIVAGLLFSVFCELAAKAPRRTSPGDIYALDTLGSVAAGMLFSLLLIPYLGSTACALAVAVATMLTGALWFSGVARTIAWVLIICITATSPLWYGAFSLAGRIATWGEHYVRSADSGYGSITILENEGQYSLFANGRFAGTVPDPVSGDYMAHIPLTAHATPKMVATVGLGETSVSEILKHGVEKVVVLELDPVMLELKNELSGAVDEPADPRIQKIAMDPRRYLATTGEKFDVIIINAGAPVTIAENRYYTREFLEILSARLTGDGVAAITIPFSENFTGREEAVVLGSIIATFPTAEASRPFPVPGPQTFLLWQPHGEFDLRANEAYDRFEQRNIKSEHFSADSAAYFFDRSRIGFAMSQFSEDIIDFTLADDKIGSAFEWLKSRQGVRPNTDSFPVCVYYNSRVVASYYPSGIMKFIDRARSALTNGLIVKVLLIGAVIVFFLGLGPGGVRSAAHIAGMAAAGFVGIASQVVLLMEFQVEFGVMYRYVGIIAGAFMLGAACGAALGERFEKPGARRGGVALIVAAIAIAGLPAVNAAWFESGDGRTMLGTIAWAPAFGLAVGFVYPWAVAAWKNRGGAGFMYAADLIGACAGAVLVSSLLIPVAGLHGAMHIISISGCVAAAAFAGTAVSRVLGK